MKHDREPEPERDEETTIVDVDKFEHETDRALLFIVDGENLWVPKSVARDYDDDYVEVALWWAEKKGL